MDEMQPLLNIRSQFRQSCGNALGDVTIPIESAGLVSAVLELRTDGAFDLCGGGWHTRNVSICLASFLAAPHQDDGGAEVTCISDEAAGVADSAGGPCEDTQVIFRREVDQRSEPVGFALLAKRADGFGDVIGAGVDVGPKQNGLSGDCSQAVEERLHLSALSAKFSGRGMKQDKQEQLS